MDTENALNVAEIVHHQRLAVHRRWQPGLYVVDFSAQFVSNLWYGAFCKSVLNDGRDHAPGNDSNDASQLPKLLTCAFDRLVTSLATSSELEPG